MLLLTLKCLSSVHFGMSMIFNPPLDFVYFEILLSLTSESLEWLYLIVSPPCRRCLLNINYGIIILFIYLYIAYDLRSRLAHQVINQRSKDEDQCRSTHRHGIAVLSNTAGWWTHGNNGLEQIDLRLGTSQLVDRLAHIVSVLSLLDRNYADRGVCVLVRGGEMGDGEVLIIGQLHLVLHPDYGWRRVRLNVALQIHVVLQSLSESWPGHLDDGRELHLQVHVTSIALAHSIVSDAVVCATVLLAHSCDLQDVAGISAAT